MTSYVDDPLFIRLVLDNRHSSVLYLPYYLSTNEVPTYLPLFRQKETLKMAQLTCYYLFLLLLVNKELKIVSSQDTETVLILDCYKCGMRDGDDYCLSRKSRWTEKSCQTTAKLSNDEALACTKTTFEDWREGKGPSIY